MKKEINKIYKGQVDLRDYDVDSCIRQQKDMVIVHKNERMILTPKELIEKRISVSDKFKSKNGGKDYCLYGYRWNPDLK